MDNNFYSADIKVTHDYGTKNVREYRAPTDDSIKILEEMREKTIKGILASLICDDNSFKCKCLLNKNNLELNYRIIVQYTFNGYERIVKLAFTEQDKNKGISHLGFLLKQAVAEDFATVITTHSMYDIYTPLIRG